MRGDGEAARRRVERVRAAQLRNLARGLCGCGRTRRPGKQTCATCAAGAARASKRRVARQRIARERAKRGLTATKNIRDVERPEQFFSGRPHVAVKRE